jgi:hypothetical protein
MDDEQDGIEHDAPRDRLREDRTFRSSLDYFTKPHGFQAFNRCWGNLARAGRMSAVCSRTQTFTETASYVYLHPSRFHHEVKAADAAKQRTAAPLLVRAFCNNFQSPNRLLKNSRIVIARSVFRDAAISK